MHWLSAMKKIQHYFRRLILSLVINKKRKKIKIKTGDAILMTCIYLFIALFTILCILPFWLIITGSITSEPSILRDGYQFFPKELTLDAYRILLGGQRIFDSYKVTVFITVVGTLLSLLVTCMMAYPLSVKRLKYGKLITFFVFLPLLFGGGLVPWYIVVTKVLNLYDNIWALIIPYLLNPWFMFLMRNFFKTIPDALMESAWMDGANDVYILFKIMLPLSIPAIATIGLFYALTFWNDWWLSMLLIDNTKLFPLQYLLRSMLSNVLNVANSLNPDMHTIDIVPAYSMRMATSILTIGPIILLYPFLQKYFVKGLTIGAIKG